MIVLGLTGSIGMGKSETARMFSERGIPVHDSDAVVHELYAQGGAAVAKIAAAFPDTICEGAVDRTKLSRLVIHDKAALARLEAIVHPLVARSRDAFLAKATAEGHQLVVLDIPLLFESGAKTGIDRVIVVSAGAEEQQRRVLARPGMTREKFDAIMRRQIPDAEKIARADFVIDTGKGLDHARREVCALVSELLKQGEDA